MNDYTGVEDTNATIDALKENPLFADVTAVKEGNFVVVKSMAAQPGLHCFDALEDVARAFHPEAFEE